MYKVHEFAAGDLIVEGNMVVMHAVHESFAVLNEDGNLGGYLQDDQVMECVFLLEDDAERQAAIWNKPPDPLPVIDKLLVPDELTEDAAAVLSASEPEYAIIEVAVEFGDEPIFVVENAPGFHECLAECPQGYGLRRWIRDAGFNIINAHGLLFTEDIPAEDTIPFDGSTSQDVIDREPDSAIADSRDAAGIGSGSF